MNDRAVLAGVPARTAFRSGAVARAVAPAEADRPPASGLPRPAWQQPVAGDSRRSNVWSGVASGPAVGSRAEGAPRGRRLRDVGPVPTGSPSIPRALTAAGLPRPAKVPGIAASPPVSSRVADRAAHDPVDWTTIIHAESVPDMPGRSGESVDILPALFRSGARRDQLPAYAPSWLLPSPDTVADAGTPAPPESPTTLLPKSTCSIMQLARMIPMASRIPIASRAASAAAGGAAATMELQRRVVPPPAALSRWSQQGAAPGDRQWPAEPNGHDPRRQSPDEPVAAPGAPLVVHLTGDVMLDGRRLGQLTASSQARQASLPSHGTSRVDLRAVPIYSGAQVPR